MIVIYARPFARSNFVQFRRDEYRPADSPLANLHDLLIDMRDRAAAHTDKPAKSPRTAQVGNRHVQPGAPTIGIEEEYEIERKIRTG